MSQRQDQSNEQLSAKLDWIMEAFHSLPEMISGSQHRRTSPPPKQESPAESSSGEASLIPLHKGKMARDVDNGFAWLDEKLNSRLRTTLGGKQDALSLSKMVDLSIWWYLQVILLSVLGHESQ